MLRFCSVALVSVLLAARSPARAEVVESTDAGFRVRNEAVVSDTPLKVYAALTERIGGWWDPGHTFSGDSRNLSLEPKAGGCLCERLPNEGGVRHLTVIYVAPGKELRLSGAMGPMQEEALSGTMIWRLSEVEGRTKVELSYTVGGYRMGGLRAIASPVDSVLRGQLQRLKSYVEASVPKPK